MLDLRVPPEENPCPDERGSRGIVTGEEDGHHLVTQEPGGHRFAMGTNLKECAQKWSMRTTIRDLAVNYRLNLLDGLAKSSESRQPSTLEDPAARSR
jgi:hypothetical protein